MEEKEWEVFHENSKVTRHQGFASNEAILERMATFHLSLPYNGRTIPLALPKDVAMPLDKAIVSRRTIRDVRKRALDFEEISTILYLGYGTTQDNRDTQFPRPFRAVPSGGGLFPLELYLYVDDSPDLDSGLYSFNSERNALVTIDNHDRSRELRGSFVQPKLVDQFAAFVIISAVFERSTFKYGERGYRFTLLEAGHVAQNISLVCTGLAIGSTCIGGYFDADLDRTFGCDGVNQSIIYVLGIGSEKAG